MAAEIDVTDGTTTLHNVKTLILPAGSLSGDPDHAVGRAATVTATSTPADGSVTTARLADAAVTAAKVAAANVDGTAGTASLRTLGTGAAQAAAGNHAHTTYVAGAAAGYALARGVGTTGSAADDLNTGLSTVVAAVASWEADVAIGNAWIQAVVGDQSGAPAAGHVTIKSWKATSNADPTPVAATSFTKKFSWIAVGLP